MVDLKNTTEPTFDPRDEGSMHLEDISISGVFDDKPAEISVTMSPGDYTVGGSGGALFTLTEQGVAKLPEFIREQILAGTVGKISGSIAIKRDH